MDSGNEILQHDEQVIGARIDSLQRDLKKLARSPARILARTFDQLTSHLPCS